MNLAPTNHDLLKILRAERSNERAQQIVSIVKTLGSAGETALHDAIETAVCHRVLAEDLPPDASWIDDLVAALPEEMYAAPLVVESEAPRANVCETLLLASAALGSPDTLCDKLSQDALAALAYAPRRPWRIGHVLVPSARDRSRAYALPIFAAYLAYGRSGDMPALAEELDEDHAVRAAMRRGASCAEIAKQWLTSPSRSLARFPERTLARLGSDDFFLTPQRLFDAVGLSEPSPAIPGSADAGATWMATNEEPPAELLRALSTAPTAWQRNRAVYMLLGRNRIAVISGVEVDLHREVALHVAMSLGPERVTGDPSRGFGAAEWLRFETATLRQGYVVASRAMQYTGTRVRAAWLIGDWIGRVLRESPFLGADPDLLASRLEAVPVPVAKNEDPLSPAYLGTNPTDLNLGEVWLLYALLRAQAEARWDPPAAVLDGLRGLAGRTVQEAERVAEECLENGTNTLGWSCAHVAPPMVARWLLHAHRATWLAALETDARKETLDLLERWMRTGRLARGVWIMLAIYREAANVADIMPRSQSIWTEAFERVCSGTLSVDDVMGPFCLWGTVHVDGLSPEHGTNLVALARRTPPTWRVGVLVALADAARAQTVARAAREAILDLVASTSAVDRTLRLPAAIAAFQAARKLPVEERQNYLDRMQAGLDDDLRAHPNIRLELKRVGRAA